MKCTFCSNGAVVQFSSFIHGEAGTEQHVTHACAGHVLNAFIMAAPGCSLQLEIHRAGYKVGAVEIKLHDRAEGRK